VRCNELIPLGKRRCLNCEGSGFSQYSAEEIGKPVTCTKCKGEGLTNSPVSDTDESREQFEAWCEITCRNTAKCLSGEYQLDQTEADWEAWQASRACRVRIPPLEWFGDNFAGYAIDKHALIEVMEQQGFTVEDEE